MDTKTPTLDEIMLYGMGMMEVAHGLSEDYLRTCDDDRWMLTWAAAVVFLWFQDFKGMEVHGIEDILPEVLGVILRYDRARRDGVAPSVLEVLESDKKPESRGECVSGD